MTGLGLALLFLAVYFMQRRILLRGFLQEEHSDAYLTSRIVGQTVEHEINRLSIAAKDWGLWDATHSFMEGRNPGYVEENLTDTTLANLSLDEMLFINTSGEVVHALSTATGREIPLAEDSELDPIREAGMRSINQGHLDQTSGVAKTARGVLLVAIQPISNNGSDAPPTGLLVVAERLSGPDIMKRLAASVVRTPGGRGDVRIVDTGQATPQDILSRAPATPLCPKGCHHRPLDDRTLLVCTWLKDLNGRHAVLMEVRQPRTLYALGLNVLSYQVAIGLAVLLLLVLVGIGVIRGDSRREEDEPADGGAEMPIPRAQQIVFVLVAFVVFGLAAFMLELLKEFAMPGADVWTRSTLTLFYIATLGALGVRFALIRYRTQRDAAERQLRASEDRYRTIFETNPSVILIIDFDTRIRFTNPEAAKVLGYPREDIEGRMCWPQFIHPDDLPRLKQYSEARSRGEYAPTQYEFRLINRAGETRHLFACVQIIPDSSLFVVSALDITEQRSIREQLREQEAFLQQVFGSIQDGLVVLDRNYVIRSINPAMERRFPEEAPLVGRSCHNILCGSNSVCEGCPVQATFDTGQSGSAIVEGTDRKDGATRWTDIYSFPLRNPKTGGVDHVICYMRNATDRMKAEESLRATNELLQDANRRLQDAMERVSSLARRAEEASAAKSEFLANLTHELRTPLNGILGALDLALETNLPGEAPELLQSARTSALSLLNIINGILEYAEVQRGNLSIENTLFDLREEIPDALRTVAGKAESKGLALAHWVAPDIPRILVGDCFRLQQVLLHLVDNSVKFTEKGDICVTAERDPETDVAAGGEIELLFTVRDMGIGISESDQIAVFAPFTQADGSTTRMYGGTGLGLSISRRIIEAMGGRIWIQSVVGTGTSVHFSVPLRAASPDEIGPAPEVQLDGLRVLIAKSHPLSAKNMRDTFHAWGATCTVKENGLSAFECMRDERARGKPFNLAVLDATLPGTSGIEIESRVAADPGLCGACILTLLPLDMAKRGGQIQRPTTAYLRKPVSPSELLVLTLRLTKRGEGRTVMLRADGEARKTRLRVLLAEDEAVCRKALTSLLEKRGCVVYSAATGLEVIELLGRTEVDIVLMDESMPVMDGLTAAKMIRAGEQRTGAHLRIVGMTASVADGVRGRCLAAGMDDFICKPVMADTLDAIILRAELKRHAPAAAVGDHMPVDIPAALRVLGGDADLLIELLTELLSHEDILPRLQQAIQAGDTELTMMEAHRLKGAFANVGATTARRLAAELETLARAHHLENAMLVWQKLDGEIARLKDFVADKEWLERVLKQTQNPQGSKRATQQGDPTP